MNKLKDRAARLAQEAETRKPQQVEAVPQKAVNRLAGASPLGRRKQAVAESQESKTDGRNADAPMDPKLKNLMVNLENDCKQISLLPKGAERDERKAELIEQYIDIVEDYLAGDEVHAFPPLVQVMIWAFDVKQHELALRLAEAAVAQKCHSMPERYNRNVPTFVADAVMDAAKISWKNEKVVPEFFESFRLKIMDWSIHAPIKAKYCKLAAEVAMQEEQWQAAKALLAQALELDETIKTKQLNDRCDKAIAAKAE